MLIHRQIGGGRSIRIYAPGLISGNFFHFQKVQKVLFFGYKPMGFNAREYGIYIYFYSSLFLDMHADIIL